MSKPEQPSRTAAAPPRVSPARYALALGAYVAVLGCGALCTWVWLGARVDGVRPHSLTWYTLAAARTAFDGCAAVTLSTFVGLGLGVSTRSRSIPAFGRTLLVANALPAFLVVALWRARSGGTLADVGLVVGALGCLETARSVRTELSRHWAQHLPEGGATPAARRVWRRSLGLLTPLLVAAAGRAVAGVLLLEALLACGGFERAPIPSWGGLLGHLLLGGQPFGLAALLTLALCPILVLAPRWLPGS